MMIIIFKFNSKINVISNNKIIKEFMFFLKKILYKNISKKYFIFLI